MNRASKPSVIEVGEDEIADYVMTKSELEECERQFDQVGCDWHAFQDEFIRQLIRRMRSA